MDSCAERQLLLMNFTKKQLVVFSCIAGALAIFLVCSSMISAFVVARYSSMGTAPVVVQVQPTAQAGSQSSGPVATTAPQAPLGSLTTTTVNVINAANPGSSSATTSPSGTPTTQAPADNGIPDTVEEIVKYYIDANNKVKASASKVTKTYANASNYNQVVEAGALSKIGQLLMGSFLKEQTDLNEEFTENISGTFPPGGEKCNLTVNDVAEATCKEENGVYTVMIKVKPDNNPKSGYGTGSICSIITDQSITDAAGKYISMSNVVCAYDGAYIEAKIDKATGNITDLYTYMPMYLSLTAKALVTVDAKVGLLFEERWTVNF